MKKLVFMLFAIAFIGFFGCETEADLLFTTDGMEFFIERGEYWQGEMKVFIFPVKKYPQFAAWIEDSQGKYISTLIVTDSSAKNKWTSAPKEGRSEALPVWSHKRQYNTDIVSTATPRSAVGIRMNNSSLINEQEYNIYLEINHSYDYNNFWTENNSGVNGQPSLIYHANFIAGTQERVYLTPVGHGSVDGKNGNIVYELGSFTTALKIVKETYINIK